jgi:hypothetical protein
VAIVKSSRDGPTIPVQLRGGLGSPNKIVTPVGTTTIHIYNKTISDSTI